MSSAYESALGHIAKKKGLEETEVGRLRAAVRRVGWVESKNTPDAVQQSGGPGRGTYQFEMGGSNTTAVQRLENFEKTYGPVSLSERDRAILSQEDPDFSQLSEDAQSAILVADWTMKTPGDEVGELARGEFPIKYFWAQHHWAGDPVDLPGKLQQFDNEMSDYERLGYPQ